MSQLQVTEKLIDALEGMSLCLWVEEVYHECGHPISGHEEVEVLFTHVRECNGRALRKDQIDRPIRERGQGGAFGPHGGWEDLTAVDPGDATKAGEKHREGEVHCHARAQGVSVMGRVLFAADVVVRQSCIDAKSGTHAYHRRNQQLPSADSVNECDANGVVDLSESAVDTDDHEASGGTEIQQAINSGPFVLVSTQTLSRKSETIRESELARITDRSS